MVTKTIPTQFRKISDIVVPDKMFQSIKTNNPEMDSVLSELGGLIPSQVIMITGNPGSGKTTLSAVIGSRIINTIPDKPVVFLSYEMSDFQLKLQAQKIPGFSDLLISTHEFHKDAKGLDELFKALDSIEPSMVIVDSLQKMASKMPQGPTRGQISVVERFTKWAKVTFTPVILIGHNDKGGNYAGPSFLKHEVDSHLTVWYDKESHERLFSMSKNRFGGNMESYSFRITGDGVYIASEWWKIVDSRTDEETMDIVMDFKENSSSEKINWDKFKESATSLINYLKKKESERIQNHSFIKDPEKIHLTWSGKRAYCAYKTGHICLGKQFFDRIDAKNWKILGYKSEKPFMQKFVTNKEEAALWAVLHEYIHLFKGYQRHSSKMWKELVRMANQESWLWSNTGA
jgi:SpoVK/Ycf46/Vps4 family AAA+-type ATPase